MMPLEHPLIISKRLAGQYSTTRSKAALWLAEITDGTQLHYRTEEIPDWFFEAYVDEVEP